MAPLLSRWKKQLDDLRRRKGPEPIRAVARRMVQTAFDAGFVRDVLVGRWARLPDLISVAAREGLNVAIVYRLYASTHPERLAIVDSTRSLTYGAAEEEIVRLMRGLRQELGVTRKTPVILMMQNRAEYILIWIALMRLGAAVVHASWRQTAEEFAFQLDHSGARIIFAEKAVQEIVDEVLDERPDENVTLLGVDAGSGHKSYDELLQTRPDEVPKEERPGLPSDGASGGSGNIVYTSGTTGRPKGAVRDFSTFGLVEFFRILDRLPVEVGDRHLIVSPLYHSGAQAFALMQAALGATLHLEAHFDAQRTLEALSEHEIHSVFMVPTMIRRVLELPTKIHEACPTPSLRAILSGAAPFPQALRQRAIERFGTHVVHDFYGATELGWITLINGQEMLERPRSVGRPLAGQELRIMDADGGVLDTGQTGLVYVRNAQTMQGYLRDEKATRATMRGGWMTVDDLGYLDKDGYLYIVGRARDLVISAGVNIYPAEVEEIIAQHDAVSEVAVIGIPDEAWGESLVAVVALRGAVDAGELEAHTREHLSGYKVPRRWIFVDTLPRNPTGKVLKRVLVEEYGES
ncbi:MAG: class I adenylate-forming enzyme family protein [Bradymonadaceae bacterium]